MKVFIRNLRVTFLREILPQQKRAQAYGPQSTRMVHPVWERHVPVSGSLPLDEYVTFNTL